MAPSNFASFLRTVVFFAFVCLVVSDFAFEIPKSVVFIGDGHGGGESQNYAGPQWKDPTYDPYEQRWTPFNVTWTEDGSRQYNFPYCRQSNRSFVSILAKRWGAKLENYGCIYGGLGCSVLSGGSTCLGIQSWANNRAQFGSYPSSDPWPINTQYDDMAPDLVIITGGFLDGGMVPYFLACKNYTYYGGCVPGNDPYWFSIVQPGISRVKLRMQFLLGKVFERGRDFGKVPNVFWSGYWNMYRKDVWCPGYRNFTTETINLVTDHTWAFIKMQMGTITGENGTSKIFYHDPSSIFIGHEWCTSDPWSYDYTAVEPGAADIDGYYDDTRLSFAARQLIKITWNAHIALADYSYWALGEATTFRVAWLFIAVLNFIFV